MAVSLSFLGTKSVKARKLLEGRPIVLLHSGELYLKNLKKAKLDINDLLMQCRVNGNSGRFRADTRTGGCGTCHLQHGWTADGIFKRE